MQDTFGKVFYDGTELRRDGSQFDRLFDDGDSCRIGTVAAHAVSTPGHTPACTTHAVGDAAFMGATLLMPDGGSARADFPGDDAGTFYDSIERVMALPDAQRLFMCHDYGPNGREIRWKTTVAEERAHNIHVGGGTTREGFAATRTARGATLAMPRLVIPSLQVNMQAGALPTGGDRRPVPKVPVNRL